MTARNSVNQSLGGLKGVLTGDSNGTVNSGDSVQTPGRSGQTTDATNFRSDLNLDGTINSGDQIAVRARSGNFLP